MLLLHIKIFLRIEEKIPYSYDIKHTLRDIEYNRLSNCDELIAIVTYSNAERMWLCQVMFLYSQNCTFPSFTIEVHNKN